MAKVKILTPAGESRFAWLDKPRKAFDENGEPRYEITVVFQKTDPEWIKFCKQIQAMVAETGGKGNPIGWETIKDENDKKQKTGLLKATFHTGIEFPPAVFDKFNRRMENPKIGNGSIVKVFCNPSAYKGFGGGVTLYMSA